MIILKALNNKIMKKQVGTIAIMALLASLSAGCQKERE
jgi:hypothetical protein